MYNPLAVREEEKKEGRRKEPPAAVGSNLLRPSRRRSPVGQKKESEGQKQAFGVVELEAVSGKKKKKRRKGKGDKPPKLCCALMPAPGLPETVTLGKGKKKKRGGLLVCTFFLYCIRIPIFPVYNSHVKGKEGGKRKKGKYEI